MIDAVLSAMEWVRANPAAAWWSGAASLTMFVATLVVVPVLLVKMPEDYFRHERPGIPHDWFPDERRGQHALLRWTARVGKNLAGAGIVVMGFLMLVLPGQGILTMLLGLTLLDLPGKRRLEIALLKRPGVSRAVDWLRRRYGRPPLQLPDGDSSPG